MKTYLYRASNLKSTITFLELKSISGARQTPSILAIIHNNQSAEALSMLGWHVLFHPLIQIQEALYEDLPYRASNLKSTITFLASVA